MKYLCVLETRKYKTEEPPVFKDFHIDSIENDNEGNLILQNIYESHLKQLEHCEEGLYSCNLMMMKLPEELRRVAHRRFFFRLSERERNSELGVDSLNFRVSFWTCIECLERKLK